VEPQARTNEPSDQEDPSERSASGSTAAASSEVEKLRRLVVDLERQNHRLRKRCEDAELEILKLERSLKNTENTLSFRLGYALIHSTKSVRALRNLPSVLLELRQDPRRRRPQSLASSTLAVLRGRVGRLTKRQK
jgi:predicted RNase H-like nuclease (RuvC/YqgF family)